jgi:hypothetical protein
MKKEKHSIIKNKQIKKLKVFKNNKSKVLYDIKTKKSFIKIIKLIKNKTNNINYKYK